MKKNYTLVLLACIITTLFFASCGKKEISKSDLNHQMQQDGDNLPKEILYAPFPTFTSGNLAEGHIIKTDYDGNVTYQQDFNSAVVNFERWTINGAAYYSYAVYDPKPSEVSGILYSSIMVTDAKMNVIKTIRLLNHPGHDDRVDGHDFLLLGNNHYIVETYYTDTVNNIPDSVPHIQNCIVKTPLIQEVQNGQVIFEWKASDYPEFYAASVQGNDFTSPTDPHDYMHINSIVVDPADNNLIVSFRQTDQVIKINRVTGAIMWRLGGLHSDFPINAQEQFLRQHDVTLSSNSPKTIMMVDNGEGTQRNYTRILEIGIDEKNKAITSYKQTYLPGNNTFMMIMGSVQKIGDKYFIGGGSLPELYELNANTGQLVSQRTISSNSYRALWY